MDHGFTCKHQFNNTRIRFSRQILLFNISVLEKNYTCAHKKPVSMTFAPFLILSDWKS